MQSINLVRYINQSLFKHSNCKNINNTNINNKKIINISHDRNIEYGNFNIIENCLVQNFNLESKMNDLQILNQVILNHKNPGLLAALPCFLVRLLDSLNIKIAYTIQSIANLIMHIKYGLDTKILNIVKFNRVIQKLYSAITISLLVILFNFIFAIIYLSQVLYIIFFLLFNFMISVFYIL